MRDFDLTANGVTVSSYDLHEDTVSYLLSVGFARVAGVKLGGIEADLRETSTARKTSPFTLEERKEYLDEMGYDTSSMTPADVLETWGNNLDEIVDRALLDARAAFRIAILDGSLKSDRSAERDPVGKRARAMATAAFPGIAKLQGFSLPSSSTKEGQQARAALFNQFYSNPDVQAHFKSEARAQIEAETRAASSFAGAFAGLVKKSA